MIIRIQKASALLKPLLRQASYSKKGKSANQQKVRRKHYIKPLPGIMKVLVIIIKSIKCRYFQNENICYQNTDSRMLGRVFFTVVEIETLFNISKFFKFS